MENYRSRSPIGYGVREATLKAGKFSLVMGPSSQGYAVVAFSVFSPMNSLFGSYFTVLTGCTARHAEFLVFAVDPFGFLDCSSDAES